jgi:hypothetical protein
MHSGPVTELAAASASCGAQKKQNHDQLPSQIQLYAPLTNSPDEGLWKTEVGILVSEKNIVCIKHYHLGQS